ncbi:PREDICTED: uncharacterized protein LOC109233637 [Nicotiana attenuata]|uniref:uncharacterized protein LOC109233637 n=1 Tax=Nicotiana attenuata TaxID=49451 RepID=UPI0009058763|nr:PREDICTED: uncharacterized protein LOC109233637 [Nicotiana attenuata]
MNHGIKDVYWWNDIKRNIAEFVAQCPSCQQVKIEHQGANADYRNPDMEMGGDKHGLYHGFTSFLPSPIGWFDVGKSRLHGPNMVQQAIEKVKLIRERLLTAQSRQKSYSDVRRRDLEFGVNDWCIGDPTQVVPTVDVQITENLSYEEIPVSILERQIRKLRNKEIASVKVLWRSKNVEEMMWEAEEEMKSKYPHLFQTEDMARGGIPQHSSIQASRSSGMLSF